MSISVLPKEVRLHIWALAYFSQTPRLVALETKSHDQDHEEAIFCPRYSPSPAPTIVNLCRESRAEACYQAKKAGHLVKLPSELEAPGCEQEFYFRFDTDILFLQLEGPRVRHYDDSPEVGLLAHFGQAIGCTPTLLQNVAITKVISNGFSDGSLSNVLRDFPHISRMVMMITEDVWEKELEKERFVRAAARIVRMYKLDLMNRARNGGETFKSHPFDVEFAMHKKGLLQIVPKETWQEWSDRGNEWATLNPTVDPFW